MDKSKIDHARATINVLRARYSKVKTKLTDDQIAEGLEHYRPKAKADIVVIDESDIIRNELVDSNIR